MSTKVSAKPRHQKIPIMSRHKKGPFRANFISFVVAGAGFNCAPSMVLALGVVLRTIAESHHVIQ